MTEKNLPLKIHFIANVRNIVLVYKQVLYCRNNIIKYR